MSQLTFSTLHVDSPISLTASVSPINNIHNSSTPSLPRSLPLPRPSSHCMVTTSKAGICKPKIYLAAVLSTPKEPTSVVQALADPRWFKAMREEFDSIQANKTWILFHPFLLVKVIINKWVFITKYNLDSSISRYKTRFIAKGFSQT